MISQLLYAMHHITFIILTLFCSIYSQQYDPVEFQEKRRNMIETQIKSRGVQDLDVLRAMEEVPRHLFVDEDLHSVAYNDSPLPIGHGQTISQPYIVAFMTEIIQADSHHTVLEIGTGSGYQAAVLSKLVHHVYTIEIVPELGRASEKLLKQMGYDNISVRIGDGYKGWPLYAPFDRIIVTAAPEKIPDALIDQLKPLGRMIIPVGPQWWGQDLMIVEKDENGKVTLKKSLPVRFVPMIHKDQ